jgi:hypothetical protein
VVRSQFEASLREQFERPCLYLEKTLHRRAGGVAQGVDPEFKPQNCKKKNTVRFMTNRNLNSKVLIYSIGHLEK